MSQPCQRDEWLALDDAALLRQCDVDAYRASGPGGQKRNKTSSAVRLRHPPSGLLVISEDSRSQHENKAKALKRLRRAIALEIRRELASPETPPEVLIAHRSAAGSIEISRRAEQYPFVIAAALDLLHAHHGRVQTAAAIIGISTSQLSKFIVDDDKLLAAANRIRAAHGASPLRKPG